MPRLSEYPERFRDQFGSLDTLRHRRVAIVAASSAIGITGAAIAEVAPIDAAENVIYRVRTRRGRQYVVRLTEPGRRTYPELSAELAWLRLLRRRAVAVAAPAGEVTPLRTPGIGLAWVTAFDFVPGETLAGATVDLAMIYRWGELLGSIRAASFDLPRVSHFRRYWLATDNYQVRRAGSLALWWPEMDRLLNRVEAQCGDVKLVHGDLGLANLVRTGDRLTALDFDDACWAPAAYDLAAALLDLLVDHADRLRVRPVDATRAMVAGYRRWARLDAGQLRSIELLWAALLLERAITLRRLGVTDPATDQRLLTLLRHRRLPESLAQAKMALW